MLPTVATPAHKQKRRRSICRQESEQREIVNIVLAQDILLQEKDQVQAPPCVFLAFGMFIGLGLGPWRTKYPLGDEQHTGASTW
jgi:hypothetical protein